MIGRIYSKQNYRYNAILIQLESCLLQNINFYKKGKRSGFYGLMKKLIILKSA